jgi:PAS domain S-box-containing protein
MLKIEREHKRFQSLDQMRLTPASTGESYDLSEIILNSSAEFLAEIGQKLFLLGKEVPLSDKTDLKADLLGLDSEGRAVIVTLERGSEPSMFVRAMSCAAMISNWPPQDFLERLSKTQTAELQAHLEVDVTEINQRQRVVLVGESFDFESLSAVEWLNAGGIDLVCVSVARADTFHSDAEYLWCTPLSTSVPSHQAVIIRSGEAGLEVTVPEGGAQVKSLHERLTAEIEERKRTEASLRASEERFWTLAQLSPVGIFQADAAGDFLYVNERWCDIAGLEQAEALGQGWARSMHPDDRDRVLNEWQEATEHALPFKAEYRFQRTDGGTSWVLGEAAVQRTDGGKVTGYIGTVTELHRVDSARGRGQAGGGGRS